MKGHGSKLGRKKAAAVAALFTTKNHAEAARIAGVDPSTLKRWLPVTGVPSRVFAGRPGRHEPDQRIQHNSGALASLGFKLAADAATPASVKPHLVLGLLDRGNKAVEQEDILVRLAALERTAEESKK
jgi:hypothetical protein